MGPPPGPMGPPPGPPPRRNRTGIIIAVTAGVVAVLAVVGLVVTLAVRGPGSDNTAADSSASTSESSSSKSDTTDSSESAPSTTSDAAEVYQVRDAMQTFVDALNARDFEAMKAAVCTQDRDRLNRPEGEETVVLEGLVGTTIDGDIAESKVVVHYELGNRRTESEQTDERFLKENGRWYYCPGAQPEIGT